MAIYVNMTDSFMSGWGRAKGGKSYYSILCDSMSQAAAIEKAARDRPEMKRIEISSKPRRGKGHTTIKKYSDLGGPWLAYA